MTSLDVFFIRKTTIEYKIKCQPGVASTEDEMFLLETKVNNIPIEEIYEHASRLVAMDLDILLFSAMGYPNSKQGQNRPYLINFYF